MLPLIPAFILLLLQGAPHGERLAQDGHLRCGFDAVTARLSARQSEIVLASLIAANGDKDLTDALVRLLQTPAEPEPAAVELEPAAIEPRRSRPNDAPEPIRWVFTDSQRSRDGPSTIA